MNQSVLTQLSAFVDATVPAVGLKAALILALVSTWVVCGAFLYLETHARKSYFRLWAAAWLFYSVYLAASFGLDERFDGVLLGIVRRACIGASALFMLFGSLQLAGYARKQIELAVALGLVAVWSCVTVYQFPGQVWAAMTEFVLLCVAGIFTGVLHLRHRQKMGGGNLLSTGFLIWSLNVLVSPYHSSLSPGLLTMSFLACAFVSVFIALGMTMRVLELSRVRSENMLNEFKRGVAQRRLLEREIAVSVEKYRALFDSASDAIVLVDLSNFQIVEANDAIGQQVGRPAAELVGTSLSKIYPALPPAGTSLLENKKLLEDLIGESEFAILRGGKEQVLCEGSSNLVPYYEKPVLQINAREITERKKMERQMRQTEKLSALGQLVAGVAHELNNPLAVVMGYAQLMSKHKDIDEKSRKDLHKILHESERAAKIVRNLLTFARPREPQMVVVDMNQLVADALETREIQTQGLKVVRRLAGNLPPTLADPTQIEQVLANLITNALQAVAESGGSRTLEVETREQGGKIRIMIADNGPGIPTQILDKIFDPFFTTKGPGRGTGLGLSICYSIMEEHKGKIWVDSHVGRGARFFVELPVVMCPTADLRTAAVGVVEEKDPHAPQRRLLIVDDEPGIVEILKEALTDGGYRVDTASNGAMALSRLAAEQYDVMISDLCMPEIGGEKLYLTVRERYPHMASRIIFCTGDTVSPNSRKFLEETGNRWLSKPFNIVELERLVLTTLRETAGAPA